MTDYNHHLNTQDGQSVLRRHTTVDDSRRGVRRELRSPLN